MVKVFVDGLQRNLLPSAGAVARLAALGETSTMGIFVAIRTLIKGNPNVLRRAIGAVRMALRALHLGVQPGQRIPGLRVIELRDADLLPIDEVMARLAFGPESSFVLIFVARCACGREPQIRTAQVFFFDRRPILWRDVRRIMTLVACQACVLTFERVPGFLVIENLWVPLHQREVFTVVFGVAAGALLAGT